MPLAHVLDLDEVANGCIPLPEGVLYENLGLPFQARLVSQSLADKPLLIATIFNMTIQSSWPAIQSCVMHIGELKKFHFKVLLCLIMPLRHAASLPCGVVPFRGKPLCTLGRW